LGYVDDDNFTMNDVICSGNESSIWDYEYTLEVTDCQRLSGARVICYGGDNDAGENFTLIGGNTKKEGNVCLNGQPVCHNSWDNFNNSAADVVYMKLGFDYGEPTSRSHFGYVDDNFIMNDVICSGNESLIWDCEYTLEVADCQRLSGAGVIWYGGDNDAGGNFTLIGGKTTKEGNVYLYGQPICHDFWDNFIKSAADVVCMKLGFDYGELTSRSHFGYVDDDNFIMNDVIYSGKESSIWDCEYTLEVADCRRLSGAGVICNGGDNDAGENFTLIGANTKKEGNVYLNGQPVCHHLWDNFDNSAADFVFMKLGFDYGEPTSSSHFGYLGDDNFIMNDVMCSGKESSIWDWEYTLEVTDCLRWSGAGVIRYGGDKDASVRNVNWSYIATGLVVLLLDCTVCACGYGCKRSKGNHKRRQVVNVQIGTAIVEPGATNSQEKYAQSATTNYGAFAPSEPAPAPPDYDEPPAYDAQPAYL